MIIIELGNGYEFKTIIELTGSASKCFRIPKSIILDNEMDTRRISVFLYLWLSIGRWDNICRFNLPKLIEWCGNKPERGLKGINSKFINTIDELSNKGYLTYEKESIDIKYIECKLDTDHCYNECQNGFASVYLDEIEKIMNYKKENSKDSSLTNPVILLVFAYLRLMIWNRPNELKSINGEINTDGTNNESVDIKKRKLKRPDAYNDSFIEIASRIGISEKTLLRAVDILEKLNLIVTDRAYRIKDKNGKYYTPNTIFANTYKREKHKDGKYYILASGDEYCRTEIENKAKILNKEYGGNYKIDKNKRRI